MCYGMVLACETVIDGITDCQTAAFNEQTGIPRDYCVMHHMSYGDDESNFTDDYTRNRIRHQIVEKNEP